MPKNHDISDADKKLFRDTMSGVKPLNKNDTRIKKCAPQPIKIKLKPKTIEKPNVRNDALSNHYTNTVLAETNLAYYQPQIPKARFRQLKQGLIPIDARLDLHGFTTDNARDALCDFLDLAYAEHKRCILIIHGKGGRNFQTPHLKNLVFHWLKQIPEVLALHSALPKHGGSGAVYVLVKKKDS